MTADLATESTERILRLAAEKAAAWEKRLVALQADACCEEMRHHLRRGTDHSAAGPAVEVIGGHALIGVGASPLRYCPWCGADVRERFKG